MVTPEVLLKRLPEVQGAKIEIAPYQKTHDIIEEVCDAHVFFAPDYDLIADCFDSGTVEGYCKKLFDFCVKYLPYEPESGEDQTTRSPGELLQQAVRGGTCDCKNYAGFIAGCVDAWSRKKGYEVDWFYRFASYSRRKRLPEHVFVVVYDEGEIWIDPSPLIRDNMGYVQREFNDRFIYPEEDSIIDKIPNMALHRLYGIGFSSTNVTDRESLLKNNQDCVNAVLPTGGVDTIPNDLNPGAGSGGGQVPVDTGGNNSADLYAGLTDSQKAALTVLQAEPAWINPLESGFTADQLGISYFRKVFANQNLTPAADLELQKNPPIAFYSGDQFYPLPPENKLAGSAVPELPKDLIVVFAPSFLGVPIPTDMPRPVVTSDGKLQIAPWQFRNPDSTDFTGSATNNKLVSNDKILLNLLMSAMGALVNSFSSTPYANDFARLSHYVLDLRNKDDFRQPTEVKTFAGYFLQGLGNVVQSIGEFNAKIFGAGSRLAFLGLVRINAFAFAYKLFYVYNDTDPTRLPALEKRWEELGGNTGDLRGAVRLGCVNNPILGGGVKQWIEDSIHAGNLNTPNIVRVPVPGSDTYPVSEDPATQTGDTSTAKTAGIGVVGADDIAYYIAAAGAIIAALAKFLKTAGVKDKVVDEAVDGTNVLLAATGQDPIKVANDLGVPATVTDPATGLPVVYTPPVTNQSSLMTFIKANPVASLVIGGLLSWGLWELFKPSGRRKRKVA